MGSECERPQPTSVDEGDTLVLGERTIYPCTLELVETGLVLRSDVEGTVPDPGENIVIDKEGRIYSSSSTPGTVAVWNPDGSFERSFGREGQGPNEFERGNFMLFLDGQDRLHVLSGGRQWSVLTTPMLEWVSQVRAMPIRVDDDFTIVMDDGTVVTSVPGQTWFGVADYEGNLVSTFGDLGDVGAATPPDGPLRVIAYAGGDRFWAGPMRNSADGYVLELWGLDQRRHLTIRRDVPWFPPGDGEPVASGKRPPPWVAMVHADTTGLVLAFTVIPNETWDRMQAAPLDRRRELAGQAYSAYVEVIDSRAGVVLASKHFEPPGITSIVTRFLPKRMMGYRHVEMPNGLREARFFEIELTSN